MLRTIAAAVITIGVLVLTIVYTIAAFGSTPI